MNVAKILETKGYETVTISADASVSDAVELLNRHNIGAIVVLNEIGAVAGIVSERDIVRRLRGFAGALMSQPVSAVRKSAVKIAETFYRRGISFAGINIGQPETGKTMKVAIQGVAVHKAQPVEDLE